MPIYARLAPCQQQLAIRDEPFDVSFFEKWFEGLRGRGASLKAAQGFAHGGLTDTIALGGISDGNLLAAALVAKPSSSPDGRMGNRGVVDALCHPLFRGAGLPRPV
jgi:hypothetical protein